MTQVIRTATDDKLDAILQEIEAPDRVVFIKAELLDAVADVIKHPTPLSIAHAGRIMVRYAIAQHVVEPFLTASQLVDLSPFFTR